MRYGIKELVFVLLMLGMLGSGYLFILKPADQKRADRAAETESRRKSLLDLRQATAGITNLERKITDLQEAIKFFESKLPQEKELDKILKEIWQMAEKNSLQTRTIKTMRSEPSAGYSELPIQVSLAGDFHGFYSFMLQLEKLSRITRTTQMKLEKIAARDGEMQATMTLSIFFEAPAGK